MQPFYYTTETLGWWIGWLIGGHVTYFKRPTTATSTSFATNMCQKKEQNISIRHGLALIL